jgi:glutathione S-transferase
MPNLAFKPCGTHSERNFVNHLHPENVMITLYQFKFSHYCEKVSWALDYKGIPYTQNNLLPGRHIKVARRLAPKSSLPIIVDKGLIVQDSTEIISYLDKTYPEYPLTPETAQEIKEALHWEAFCSTEIGIPLRLWFYHYALPDRKRSLQFMLDGAPWLEKTAFPFIFPKVRNIMLERMIINAETAKHAEKRVLAALDKLDDTLKDRRFLVGDRFSRADLTACALLSPFCAPGKTDAEAAIAFPETVCELRNHHRNRPYFDWVLENYKSHRQPKLGNKAII